MADTKQTILVTDDDELSRSILADSFRHAGFDVVEAKDGQDGLDKAILYKPNLVFTGVMMPNLTGFEFLTLAKQNSEIAHIPFVIFSHLGRNEDREQAHKLGAVAFLVKGLDSPKKILEVVSSLMDGKRFVIAVDPTSLDGLKLAEHYKISTPVKLKLVPEPGSHPPSFHAEIVK